MNLRKDHYRLLVFTDLLQLKPPRDSWLPALCTHRPSLLPIERFSEVLGLFGSRITLTAWREDDQTVAFRGSKSRNKVSVGEPAEGSLSVASLH